MNLRYIDTNFVFDLLFCREKAVIKWCLPFELYVASVGSCSVLAGDQRRRH